MIRAAATSLRSDTAANGDVHHAPPRSVATVGSVFDHEESDSRAASRQRHLQFRDGGNFACRRAEAGRVSGKIQLGV